MTLDLDYLYLGIDNTRPDCVRVVCLDGGQDAGPLWHGRFLEVSKFRLTVEQFLGAGTVIATTSKPADPCGAIAWLTDRGYEPHRFDKAAMHSSGGLSCVGTSAKYRRACQLAHQARRISKLSYVATGIQLRLDEIQAQLDWLTENIFWGVEVPF